MGKSNEVEVTEQETEQAAIHAEQWSQYKENGIPLENEWIRRTTGYVADPDGGGYKVDPTAGVHNADGTIKTDTSTASTANETAFGGALNQVNPNRLETATQINRDGAEQGGLSQAGMALEQQANAQMGVVNAVARGKGMEGESLQRQDQLTAKAQQDAMASAEASASNRSTNGYIAGTLAGVGGVAYNQNRLSNLDSRQSASPEFNPTVTARQSGAHHG